MATFPAVFQGRLQVRPLLSCFAFIPFHRPVFHRIFPPQRNAHYQHRPLPPGDNIRVVSIEPSRDFDAPCAAVCSYSPSTSFAVATANTHWNTMPYPNYTWGFNNCDHQILCDEHPFFVTANCHAALKHLRLPSRTRTIWVDAICIDQSSMSERNEQVKLMGDIYKLANKVFIWLGQGDATTSRVLRQVSWMGRYFLGPPQFRSSSAPIWQLMIRIFPRRVQVAIRDFGLKLSSR